jgi:Zn-dependent peptidase ImmA (M78 family)
VAEKAKAEREARALLTKFSVTSPPVPVIDIVRGLGIELSYRLYDGDISGILRRDPDRTIIGVNALESEPRQNFTIAHELGHFHLHKGYEVIVDKMVLVNLRGRPGETLASEDEEREANYFAAELLMPEKFVRPRMRELVAGRTIVSGEPLVEQLAGEFEVSKQAMTYRLVNLKLLDALAIEGG